MTAAAFVVLAILGLYVLLPRVAGLDETWDRLGDAAPAWLALAAVLEMLSFGAYAAALGGVLAREGTPLPRGEAWEITLAGIAATRLFATGGAGGVVLTAWALRRSGLGRRAVAVGLTTFLILVYAVFMVGLVLPLTGLLPGDAPLALALPAAAFGGAVIVTALALALVPADLAKRVAHGARSGTSRWRTGVARLATAPATFGEAVRHALRVVAGRDLRALGAIGWWAFDIAVLAACFAAFGAVPSATVLVLAYFVGMLGNLLPLPGGVGGVDGGMIGAFIACGTGGGPAVVAVLAYRAFAFWLPTVPGVWAYIRLRRRLMARSS